MKLLTDGMWYRGKRAAFRDLIELLEAKVVSTFKVGDVVRLKGGGPNLTVVEVIFPSQMDKNEYTLVTWFNAAGDCREDSFRTECLTPAVFEFKCPPGKVGDLYEAWGIPRPVGPDVLTGSDPSPPGKTHHDLGGEG